MAKAELRLNLRDTETVDGFPLLRPGAMLQGDLTVIADEAVRCKQLVVSVGWHTEGKGTRYAETVGSQVLFEGELRAGLPAQYAFAMPLPASRWSYQGRYVSIVWSVDVKVDVPWGRDVGQSQPFVLRP